MLVSSTNWYSNSSVTFRACCSSFTPLTFLNKELVVCVISEMHSHKSSIGCFPTCYRLNTYTFESFKLFLCKVFISERLTFCSSITFDTLDTLNSLRSRNTLDALLTLNTLNSLRSRNTIMNSYDFCFSLTIYLIN